MFQPPDVGWVIPHSPDTWIRALGMSNCTPNLDWYLREFGGPFRVEAFAQPPEVGLFDFLDAGIKATPVGSAGLIFHGYLAPGGERAPFIKPSARGMFNGITGSHTRWHLLRAVYEGVAYGIRDCLDSIPTRSTPSGWPAAARTAPSGRRSSPTSWAGGSSSPPVPSSVPRVRRSSPASASASSTATRPGVDATVNIVREYEPDRSKTDDLRRLLRDLPRAPRGDDEQLGQAAGGDPEGRRVQRLILSSCGPVARFFRTAGPRALPGSADG